MSTASLLIETGTYAFAYFLPRTAGWSVYIGFCSSHFASKDKIWGSTLFPLIISTQNKSKRGFTYQQHLCEWDILLSKPNCFSYNHTLKLFQCLFFLTMRWFVRVADNNPLSFEKILCKSLLCMIWILYHSQKKLYPNKHFPV